MGGACATKWYDPAHTHIFMKTTLNAHQKRRDDLLAEIIAALSNDDRFVAGWLTGSLSRNDSDSLSDIDINLVVGEKEAAGLCQRPAQVSAQTSAERFALASQFGTPALIHENNNNAPKGGTFTFILYAESAIMVDWTLIPQSSAVRPIGSKILFDKAGIPVSDPTEIESLEQSRQFVAEQWAFFWMMTAVTIKYIIRGDGVFVAQWIEYLNGMIHDIERHMNRKPWSYTRGSLSQLQSAPEKQLEAVHQLCKRMKELHPKVVHFTEAEQRMPLEEIETLLSLSNK
jgi:predicted nucleotidyltransferase